MCYTHKQGDIVKHLKNQILVFYQLHSLIEEKWLSRLKKENIEKINFNRQKVKDIDIDTIEYIHEYRKFLSITYPYIIKSLNTFGIERARVKEILSISQKIKKYNCGQLHGEVIINKCLNDIFGARVVIEDCPSFEIVKKYILENVKLNIKITNANKVEGYRGLHVYIKSATGHFYWEMQIWNRSDYDKNISLHEQYKRGYVENLGGYVGDFN